MGQPRTRERVVSGLTNRSEHKPHQRARPSSATLSNRGRKQATPRPGTSHSSRAAARADSGRGDLSGRHVQPDSGRWANAVVGAPSPAESFRSDSSRSEFGFDRHDFFAFLQGDASDDEHYPAYAGYRQRQQIKAARRTNPQPNDFERGHAEFDSRFYTYESHDPEARDVIARKWITRNIDRMAAVHNAFAGKTQRQVHDMITNTPDFGKTMVSLESQERTFDQGVNSSQMKEGMTRASARRSPRELGISSHRGSSTAAGPEFAGAGRRHYANKMRWRNDPNRIPFDPFGNSLNTSRSEREARQERLFRPTLEDTSKYFNRTRGTIPEYGNFSAYTGALISSGQRTSG